MSADPAAVHLEAGGRSALLEQMPVQGGAAEHATRAGRPDGRRPAGRGLHPAPSLADGLLSFLFFDPAFTTPAAALGRSTPAPSPHERAHAVAPTPPMHNHDHLGPEHILL
ncbi:hypothetical protein FXW78_54160 [Rhodococcus opacus]|nr:hypothetical protein [Rhodococcus opacus]